ncbi:uncharacterized protein LOC134692390 [Mytilus trossulus]|uniref:uncharacterized protein LOC134692390 n=1 Tax=Mytilus trossulus TaxID=6551 RepID=UPI003004DDBA
MPKKSKRLQDQLQLTYRAKDKGVKRSARKDKRQYLEDLSKEAEKAAILGELSTVYKITKQAGKAPDIDSIHAEMLKADLETSSRVLHNLFLVIWKEGDIPSDWSKGLIVKLPTKGNLRNCDNWRGITLLSVPRKRKPGRPRITWRRTVTAELEAMGYTWGQAQYMAWDREKWRPFVVALCPTGDEKDKDFHVWIGLRKDEYGTVKWTDDSTPTWTKYRYYSRDNVLGEEVDLNCYALDAEHGNWDKKTCTERLGFVCEMDIGQCTFEHRPPSRGCNSDLLMSTEDVHTHELNQSECQTACLKEDNVNDIECWAAAHRPEHKGDDCWLFFTKATDYCVQNEANYADVSLFIKTCFQALLFFLLFYFGFSGNISSTQAEAQTEEDVIPEVYETMKAETSSTDPPCACSCRSTNKQSTQQTATSRNTTVHMSPEEIQESVDKIVREIKVNKNSTSQYKRKFKSAPDDRFSAQVIGISGVSIVGIISLVVVGFDLKNLYDAFETMYHRLKDLSKTRSIP